MTKKKRGGKEYLIAVAALALATLVRGLAGPELTKGLPLITYFIAVIAVAWLATLGPSLLTLLGGAVAGYLLFSPDWAEPTARVLLRYFIIGGAVIIAFHTMRRAYENADRHQALLAGTVRTSLDSVVMIDHRDNVIEFNEAAERTFGYRRDEVLGKPLAGLIIPPALRERHAAAFKRYLETGTPTILEQRIEISAIRADGTEFPVELAVTRIASADPPIFTAYIRDISERRRAAQALEESEHRFRQLVDQIHDYAIFMMDLEGRATSWNQGVRRILHYEEAEFVGREVKHLIFPPDDVAQGVPEMELRTAVEKGAAPDDRWMKRKGGELFFAMGVAIPRRGESGQLIGYAKIMRDQTARKHLEEELRTTAARLARVNEQQSRFLAMLSHELRNPLAPIRNGVAILKLTGGQGVEATRAVEMITRQVAQMVRLIDDLLDVNRIRGGKIRLQLERVDLAKSLGEAVEIAEAQCGRGEHRFESILPDEPLWIDADKTRIGQVVSNLVHNACKFTPGGGRVRLRVAREGDEAVIRVTDTGMGIPAERLEQIFGLFEQLEVGPDAAESGLGLGLTLSRSLVRMHGGTLTAHSEGTGKGSEFVVRLPLAQPGDTRAPAPDEEPAATPGARSAVLVVDDNHDAAESLATVARLNGHEVHVAHDGEAALECFERYRPGIVLLDIGLPRIDGYEVARRLRARKDGGVPPLVVAITGWGQEEDVTRARDAGFDAHVTKPIDYDALLAILAGGGRDDRGRPGRVDRL